MLLVVVSSDVTGSDLLSPNETNIVAYENEEAVLPCKPSSSSVNVTLYKGYSRWSAKRIFLGRQPYRNQNVKYDPKVGFILDPVTEQDVGTFWCRGIKQRHIYRMGYRTYDMQVRWEIPTPDAMKFTLDVNTGHLLAPPNKNVIIVKEGSDAVLPCTPYKTDTTVVLYKDIFGFARMKLGRQDRDYDGGDEMQILSYDYKKGFIFNTVSYSDDATYKCEAKSQHQKEVIYFYMHVDQLHLLHGTEEHYISVYKGEDVVLPCKPSNQSVNVTLFYTSAREIYTEPSRYYNQTVTYDPNVGFTLKGVSLSDAGTYRCSAKMGQHEEAATFFVYVNTERLLKHISDCHINPSENGSAVIPCLPEKSNVKVTLYRETVPGVLTVVPLKTAFPSHSVVYDPAIGFTVHYYSIKESTHFLCMAELGEEKDLLNFYWYGENILHHTSSHIILADADDKAVLPCRPSNDGTEVKLFIGRSLLKQREIQMGKQPHRNQTVTYNPIMGFTLEPVSLLDSNWYKCIANLGSRKQIMEFYLEVHAPPCITETNLKENKNLTVNAGTHLVMFCKSEGMPYPDTFWFKDGELVVIDDNFELSNRNQSLIIKVLQPEHEGTYSCKVQNEMGEEQAEGNLTIADVPPSITSTNLNKSQNLITKLNDSLTIFCKSQGKPEPEAIWFKDGKPVITDANVEVKDKNQTLIIKVVKLEHNGTYHCKVWNPLGEVQAEGNVTIADTEPARIIDTNLNVTQNLEVKLGDSLTIFCRSKGNPEPETHWFKDGKPLDPDNTMKESDRNQELNIIQVKLEHRGKYRCVVSNGLENVQLERTVSIIGFLCIDINQNETQKSLESRISSYPRTHEDSATNRGAGVPETSSIISLTEPAKIIETNLNVSQNLAVEAGANLTMFCKAEGNPPPQITWFKDDKPLDSDSTVELKDYNQTLVINGVKTDMKGVYRCVVHNQLGEMQTLGTVNITDESATPVPLVTITVVCIIILITVLAVLVLYIRRKRLYKKLNKPEGSLEEDSDFSDRLLEEFPREPRLHLQEDFHRNLIGSEHLPEASRGPIFLSDESNIPPAGNSRTDDNFPPHMSAVRSIEMKSM